MDIFYVFQSFEKIESKFVPFLSFCLTCFSGIIIALLTSYLQRRSDAKKISIERIDKLYTQLVASYRYLLALSSGDIERLMNIQKFSDCLYKQGLLFDNSFSILKLDDVHFPVVLTSLNKVLLTLSANKPIGTKTNQLIDSYYQYILKNGQELLDTTRISSNYRSFSLNATGPARDIGGVVKKELDDLDLFVAEACNSNFNNYTIWDIQRKYVAVTDKCEKLYQDFRISTKMEKKEKVKDD